VRQHAQDPQELDRPRLKSARMVQAGSSTAGIPAIAPRRPCSCAWPGAVPAWPSR